MIQLSWTDALAHTHGRFWETGRGAARERGRERCIYMYTYIYTYACPNRYTHTHTHEHEYTYICIHTHSTHTHTRTRIQIHMYIHTFSCLQGQGERRERGNDTKDAAHLVAHVTRAWNKNLSLTAFPYAQDREEFYVFHGCQCCTHSVQVVSQVIAMAVPFWSECLQHFADIPETIKVEQGLPRVSILAVFKYLLEVTVTQKRFCEQLLANLPSVGAMDLVRDAVCWYATAIGCVYAFVCVRPSWRCYTLSFGSACLAFFVLPCALVCV